MTATVARPGPPPGRARLRGYRFELVKLLSQWRIRLLLLACWIAPGGLRRRGERAELAARRHGLRPLDARDRLGRARWWCWPSRAAGRSRC